MGQEEPIKQEQKVEEGSKLAASCLVENNTKEVFEDATSRSSSSFFSSSCLARFAMSSKEAGEEESLAGTFFEKERKVLHREYAEKVVKYAKKRADKTTEGLAFVSLPCLYHKQIQLGKVLGEGSFSTVYEIESISKGDSNNNNNNDASEDETLSSPPYVVKCLRQKLSKNPAMLSACAADIFKEGRFLASLQHANVLKCLAWSSPNVCGFRNGRHDAFFLVLEKLDRTLSTQIKEWIGITVSHPWNKAKRNTAKIACLKERLGVAKQIASAVEYMHSQNILHRDLKPDNIGLGLDGHWKVFDFDVSRKLMVDEPIKYTRRVGSPRYMSPEVARGEAYNIKADVYTFGLLAHQIYTLEKPYEEIPAQFHDELVYYQGARPYIPRSWPTSFQTFLESSWGESIDDRPDMTQVCLEFHAVCEELIQAKQEKYFKSPKKISIWRFHHVRESDKGNNSLKSSSTPATVATTTIKVQH